MARVIVVGAGLGGLAAAARLAATGHDVTVLEAADGVGGKLGRIEHATGVGTFAFDTGPSLLIMPELLAELFAATGEPLESALSLRRLDPSYECRFADGARLTVPSDPAGVSDAHDNAFGPGAGAAWKDLLERGRRIWQAVEQPVLRHPLTPASAARRMGRISDLAAVAPGRTMRHIGRHYLSDPRQRMLLDRYATYAGSDPRRTPAALSLIPYLEHSTGAWYIDGGLHRLATAVAERAVERGARIRTGEHVSAIHAPNGKISSVTLINGEHLPADVVVANCDAHDLYGRLLTPVARRVPPADSLSGFVMLLGLRGATPDLAHHTVVFGAADYDTEFDALFARPAGIVTDPVIYLARPDDPTAAPPGHEACFVLVNAPRHGRAGVDWTAPGLAEGYADSLLRLLAERGLPIADRVLFRDLVTPADLERRTLAPGGAIYGSALHGFGASFRRPTNTGSVRGLYLVGGSTHPGGGLPMVVLSAAIVADLIGPG